MVIDLINQLGWDLVHQEALPARPSVFIPKTCQWHGRRWITSGRCPRASSGTQKEALSQFLDGRDVCLTTGPLRERAGFLRSRN